MKALPWRPGTNAECPWWSQTLGSDGAQAKQSPRRHQLRLRNRKTRVGRTWSSHAYTSRKPSDRPSCCRLSPSWASWTMLSDYSSLKEQSFWKQNKQQTLHSSPILAKESPAYPCSLTSLPWRTTTPLPLLLPCPCPTSIQKPACPSSSHGPAAAFPQSAPPPSPWELRDRTKRSV